MESGDLAPGRADAIERGHEATKLVPGPGAAAVPASPAELHDPALAQRNLPGGRAVGVPLERCVEVRRSAASFLTRPISLEDLGFVLEMAAGPLEREPGLEVRLVVHRVRDLSPGLYRYDGARHALELLREGDLRTSMTRVCLGQRKAGRAAVSLAVTPVNED